MAWMFDIDQVENWAYMDNVFTPEECQKIIDYGNSLENIKASVSKENIIDNKIRDSNISWIKSNEHTKWFYEKLAYVAITLNNNFFKFNLYGFIEDLQFTKYEKDQYYSAHLDKIISNQVRKLSIVVQLSNEKDYDGGELKIYENKKGKSLHKAQGTVFAFPSYMLHEVLPVKKGTRYSLVTWISGPSFK